MSAALSAIAVDAQEIANPATAPTHDTLSISLMVSLPFMANARRHSPCYPLAGPRDRLGILCGPRGALCPEAAAIGLQSRLEARLIQDRAVDHAPRRAAVLDVQHRLH